MGCPNCDYTEGGDPIEQLKHNMVETVAEVPATCTAPGTTARHECSYGCGTTTGGEPIEQLVHQYGEDDMCIYGCGTKNPDAAPDVAFIGDKGYATVQAAVDAVQALETIVITEDVTGEITVPAALAAAGKIFYIQAVEVEEGEEPITISLTVAGDYTIDVAGRFVRSDNKLVNDSAISFKYTDGKAVVRPVNVATSTIGATANLDLEAAIQLRFGVKTANYNNAKLADIYMVIDMADENGLFVDEEGAGITALRLTVLDKDNDDPGYTDRYSFVLDGVPAKCLNNTVVGKIYCVNADGTIACKTVNYGFNTYLTKQIDKPASAGMDKLAAAIMNYGAAAQKNFNYNTANLLNTYLKENASHLYIDSEDGFDAAEKASDLLFGVVSGVTSDPTNPDNNWYGNYSASIWLQDTVALDLKPNKPTSNVGNLDTLTLEYTYIAADGTSKTETIKYEDWKNRNGEYKASIEMPAKYLRSDLTIKLFTNYGTENQAQVLKTYYIAGVAGYAGRVYDSAATPELKVLYRAIMYYTDIANAYFAGNLS